MYERAEDGCYASYEGVLPDMGSAQCAYDESCQPDRALPYEQCVMSWIERTASVPECFDGCGAADCVDAYRAAAATCAETGAQAGDATIDDLLDACLHERPWTGPGCVE